MSIHNFLKDLRNYWNENYSKNFLKLIKIRSKLGERKTNFYHLSWYKDNSQIKLNKESKYIHSN